MALVRAKAEGQDVVYEEEREAPQVSDLLAALKASVEATKGGRVRGAEAMRAATGGEDADARSGTAGDDLADLSKAELTERAKQADIAGRSSMTKGELVEALRAAG